MKMAVQYSLFETREESEHDAIIRKIDELDQSCHRIRKGIFAKHNELLKRNMDLERRMEILEKYICKGEMQ